MKARPTQLTPPFDIARYIKRSTAASRVPLRVRDPKALAEAARLLSDHMPQNAA